MDQLSQAAKGKDLLIWDFDGTIASFNVNWESIIDRSQKEIEEALLVCDYEVDDWIVNFIKKNDRKTHSICSSNSTSPIVRVLDHIGILDNFSYIISRENVIDQKPSPEGLFILLRLHNCEKEQCLFIGDSQRDEEAAAEAGIDYASVL
ncbi:MAG: HAD family hydrolase [Candidatus Thorarchaeota archaeon]|jgi:phosphoglycolate phosphatase